MSLNFVLLLVFLWKMIELVKNPTHTVPPVLTNGAVTTSEARLALAGVVPDQIGAGPVVVTWVWSALINV